MNIHIDETPNQKELCPMTLYVHYPYQPGPHALRGMAVATIRAVAAQVRHQVQRDPDMLAVTIPALVSACQQIDVNGRCLDIAWDLAHPVSDEKGRPVLGICGTEPDEPDCAYISVNPELTVNRPDLELSTAAHELGHMLFDVPAALATGTRHYRAIAAGADVLDRSQRGAEGRANEFMGAFLTPPIALHTRLLAMARSEGLRLSRAPHQGRPCAPVLAAGNPPDAVAGIMAALAAEFGVSERFVTVRVSLYGLIKGGR